MKSALFHSPPQYLFKFAVYLLSEWSHLKLLNFLAKTCLHAGAAMLNLLNIPVRGLSDNNLDLKSIVIVN